MALVTVSDSTLTAIAEAIREQLDTEDTYKPSEMPDAIESISGDGGATLGTKTITQNGTYDAEDDSLDGYSEVTVNVSGGGSSGYDIDSGNFYALCDKFATDYGFTKVPITIASDLTDYYTVTHNLGTVPTDCFLYPVNLQASGAGYQLGYTHDSKFGQDNSGNRTFSYASDAHTAGYLTDKTFISLLGSITRNDYNFAKNATATTVDIRGGTNSSTKLLAGSYILAVK